eukprot:4881283-Amphidinium_carterae.1
MSCKACTTSTLLGCRTAEASGLIQGRVLYHSTLLAPWLRKGPIQFQRKMQCKLVNITRSASSPTAVASSLTRPSGLELT